MPTDVRYGSSVTFSTWSSNDRVQARFARFSSTGNPTLFDLAKGGLGTPAEYYWLAALLNAVLSQTTNSLMNNPYLPTEVMAFYAANDTKALEFFKGYLQTGG